MSDLFEPENTSPPSPPLAGFTGVGPTAVDPGGYLSNLNEGQRQAVEAVDGPVLVLAGAGTGKTRVLTTRIGHILMQGKARPGEILAVTFTNKAALEMKERVGLLVNRSVDGWWVGTFHALGARILRNHAEAVGLKSNFTILDTDDQVRLLKQLLENHEIDDKDWPPRVLSGVIQRWKDRGLTPDKVSKADAEAVAEGKALALYRDYQQRLKEINAADFGDLLLLCLSLFQDNPPILKQYQQRFRYILVDEYQDTNVAQYLWLRLLAQGHNNICCVGDDDQSVYSWRGAEVGNILGFETHFPGATVVRLERNYRSTEHILAAASGLIAHNEGRLGKTLWTEDAAGEKVRVRGVWDGTEEARFIGEEIEVLQTKGKRLNTMAVLVRAGFQTREFEERLITLGLPYRVIGGARFYERQENRDAIAYLRVVAQPDDDLAFERIVNLPKRGLGDATMHVVHGLARAEGISLTQSVRRLIETDELKPKPRQTLADVLALFDRWREMMTIIPLVELANTILDESGYREMWKNSKAMEAPGRLENLKELGVALGEFENLGTFLEHVSLVMENESSGSDDKVTLMTLHGAKGLEFDTVFLPGWEEGLFPHQRSLDDIGGGGLEEERRLAYVGLTRARERAIISTASNRRIYGQWQSAIPSRFIEELPADHVNVIANPGFSGGEPDAGYNNTFGGSGQWKRSATRRQHAPVAGNEWRQASAASTGRSFTIGQRIFHQKFGYGRVVQIEDNKLEIEFEKAGTKKVMDSFVEAV